LSYVIAEYERPVNSQFTVVQHRRTASSGALPDPRESGNRQGSVSRLRRWVPIHDRHGHLRARPDAAEAGVSCLQHHACVGRLSVDCLEALGESVSYIHIRSLHEPSGAMGACSALWGGGWMRAGDGSASGATVELRSRAPRVPLPCPTNAAACSWGRALLGRSPFR
jgi:hypothetical protein